MNFSAVVTFFSFFSAKEGDQGLRKEATLNKSLLIFAPMEKIHRSVFFIFYV